MPIADFISGVKCPVDLYIRLSNEKFICIAKQGSKPQRSQLSSYQDKSVSYLWIKKSEYAKLGRHNSTIAGVAVQSDRLSAPHKTQIVSSAAASVFKQLDHLGINIELYDQAKSVSLATVALVEQHNDLSLLFQTLNNVSSELLSHSMAVSALSVLIGQEMAWEGRVTMEKLALGGLLHDVGKKVLPKELINKPLSEMSREELQLYETHAYRGMQLLNSLGCVPDDVISIVYEHHENSIGQGYPRRLRGLKMHPLAKVISLSNQFVNLVISNINNPKAKSAREALLFIEHTMGQPYDKDSFSALQRIIEKPYAVAS
jgi:putative nucleotidyltransferase with HDIG domain